MEVKHLASGKKSVEQLRPIMPWQTSALELILFCYFLILLVYHCALYLWNANFIKCVELVLTPMSLLN